MSTIFDRIMRWLRLDTRPDNADEDRYDRAEREMERRMAAIEAATQRHQLTGEQAYTYARQRAAANAARLAREGHEKGQG